MGSNPILGTGPHWAWAAVGVAVGIGIGVFINLSDGEDASGKATKLPGVRYAFAILYLGIILAGGVILGRGDADSWASVLAPAAQTLLAAVVAAFGVTQIIIARDAMVAARDSVAATEDQTQEMRNQTAAATAEAKQRTSEAASALESSRQERLDSYAPMAALLSNGTSFVAWEAAEHGDEEEKTTFKPRDMVQEVILTYRFHLTNFGLSPISYSIDTSNEDLEVSDRRGAIVGNDILMFSVTETRSLRDWIHHLEHLQSDREPIYGRVTVTVHGQASGVYDLHTLRLDRPRVTLHTYLTTIQKPEIGAAVAYRDRFYHQDVNRPNPQP